MTTRSLQRFLEGENLAPRVLSPNYQGHSHRPFPPTPTALGPCPPPARRQGREKGEGKSLATRMERGEVVSPKIETSLLLCSPNRGRFIRSQSFITGRVSGPFRAANTPATEKQRQCLGDGKKKRSWRREFSRKWILENNM